MTIQITVDNGEPVIVDVASTAVGFTGSRGYVGSQGAAGTNGYTGSQGALGYTGSRGFTGSVGTAGTDAHFAPMPELLTADRTVIIGASLMQYSFGNANNGSVELKAHLDTLRTKLGFTGPVTGRGVESFTLSQIITEAGLAKTEFAAEAGDVTYVVHAGGNDVSNRRPYVRADDLSHFQTSLATLNSTLAAGGDRVAFMRLSKRLYPSGVVVSAANAASSLAGSLPYNVAAYDPFILANQPKFAPTGEPWFDFYKFVERWQDRYLVVADGVHPHYGCYSSTQEFVLGRLAARARGVLPPTTRAGRAYVFTPMVGAYSTFPTSPVDTNVVRLTAQGDANGAGKGVGTCWFDTNGIPDYYLEFGSEGWKGTNTSGAGANSFPLIEDTRLHNATFLARSMFIDNTEPNPNLRFQNLCPGDKGRIILAASRAVADSNRNIDATVQTVTKTLNAATNAASNQQTWDFTVPASGIVDIDFALNSANGYWSIGLIEFY